MYFNFLIYFSLHFLLNQFQFLNKFIPACKNIFHFFYKCVPACGTLQMNLADFGRVSPMTMENPCYLSTRVIPLIAGWLVKPSLWYPFEDNEDITREGLLHSTYDFRKLLQGYPIGPILVLFLAILSDVSEFCLLSRTTIWMCYHTGMATGILQSLNVPI